MSCAKEKKETAGNGLIKPLAVLCLIIAVTPVASVAAGYNSIPSDTPIDTTVVLSDSTIQDTTVSDTIHHNIIKSIIEVIPDTVAGVPTNYVPNKVFGTLESLAKDTFAIDTSEGLVFKSLAFTRRVYSQLYITIEKATSIGVTSISDPERIVKLKDYFSENGRKSGWHPLIDFTSRTRIKVGSKTFYRSGGTGLAFRWLYTDREKWLTKAYLTHQWVVDNHIHQISAAVERRVDDDMFYYGFGKDPAKNPKSYFLPNAISDRGLFSHAILKAQAILGVRIAPEMSFRLSMILTERRIIEPDPGTESKFDEVFDVSKLAGDIVGRNFYNELAASYDSRSQFEGLSRGLKAEMYCGMGVGIGSADKSSFLRYGFETVRSIPFFNPNRQIVSKITVNMVENLNKKHDLNFYDYPRHPSFRGVSTRFLYRTDKIVSVTTLEFDQKLNKKFMGTAFFDGLVVGPTAEEMGWNEGAWAAGIKLTYHNRYSELASVLIAYGPEGVRIGASIGTQKNRNERSRWH